MIPGVNACVSPPIIRSTADVKKMIVRMNFAGRVKCLCDCVFCQIFFRQADEKSKNIFCLHLHLAILKYTFALPFWKEVVGKMKTESLRKGNSQLITSGMGFQTRSV